MLGTYVDVSICRALLTSRSPGRFFAANELKALLAHVVMHYDVRMEEPGVLPPAVRWTATKSPNRDAQVLFRRRQTKA